MEYDGAYCPMTFNGDDESQCTKKMCAWWCDNEKECVIRNVAVSIKNFLDFQLTRER